jgi:hypothetical protein
MATTKSQSKEKQQVRKIEGAIINGVKYNRETDFSRDDTANLIRKYKKYADYQDAIKEVLKRRIDKLQAKGTQNEELLMSIKEIIK